VRHRASDMARVVAKVVVEFGTGETTDGKDLIVF
jgi:hypothetical protein